MKYLRKLLLIYLLYLFFRQSCTRTTLYEGILFSVEILVSYPLVYTHSIVHVRCTFVRRYVYNYILLCTKVRKYERRYEGTVPSKVSYCTRTALFPYNILLSRVSLLLTEITEVVCATLMDVASLYLQVMNNVIDGVRVRFLSLSFLALQLIFGCEHDRATSVLSSLTNLCSSPWHR